VREFLRSSRKRTTDGMNQTHFALRQTDHCAEHGCDQLAGFRLV
jgi:hypothetical protein